MSDEVRFVRLRPYDPRTGHTCQVFTQKFGGQFYKFNQAGVWYKVPKALADELALKRQIAQRPTSPPVFDVMTEEQARAFDAAEARRRAEEKAVEEPSVDTAKNMMADGGVGRGDLSLADVGGVGAPVSPPTLPPDDEIDSRREALAAASARASGDDVEASSTPPAKSSRAKAPKSKAKSKAKSAKPKPKAKRSTSRKK